jgi:hypothetical protein
MDPFDIKSIKNDNDITKQICSYTFIVIFLIIIFIISPLRSFTIISKIVRIIILIILGYTVYLNYKQTIMLRTGNTQNGDIEFANQLKSNITVSYVFTLFLILLFIFVLKSLFH